MLPCLARPPLGDSPEPPYRGLSFILLFVEVKVKWSRLLLRSLCSLLHGLYELEMLPLNLDSSCVRSEPWSIRLFLFLLLRWKCFFMLSFLCKERQGVRRRCLLPPGEGKNAAMKATSMGSPPLPTSISNLRHYQEVLSVPPRVH